MLIFGINKVAVLLDRVAEDNRAIMTILPRPEERSKLSYRIMFNSAGLQMMDYNSHTWTIGQEVNVETRTIRYFFVNISDIPANTVPNFTFKICNNGNVNNKKLWTYIRESFNNNADQLRFILQSTIIDGINVLLLQEYFPENESMPSDIIISDDGSEILEIPVEADELILF